MLTLLSWIAEKLGRWTSRATKRPITVPDFDGGCCTFYPDGTYSHKL